MRFSFESNKMYGKMKMLKKKLHYCKKSLIIGDVKLFENSITTRRKCMKIAVVCDSGTGLSKKEAEALGLFYLPLQIVDEDKTYLDGIDITCEEVFDMIKNGKMMKTSLPPLGMVRDLFVQLKKEGYEHIICSSINSGLSSTIQSLIMIAKDVEIGIDCMDCQTTCYIQRYIAQAAKQLVDEGVELEEIIRRLKDSIEHSDTLIIPDDLNHLKRGGRLTPLAATLGGMLKIKPVLRLDKETEGKIDTFAKVRTMSKAMTMAIETFDNRGIDENYLIAFAHTGEVDAVQEYKEMYFNKYPNSEHIYGYIGPVIAVHTGIGCLGIQYIKKV